ncbi:TPA: hypothetical protein P5S63_001911 [Salmonella enterica subsp. enterica serovar Concord]|nr:hypothetical protein [Salmonella enterica subsp. enterica serovar Concord]
MPEFIPVFVGLGKPEARQHVSNHDQKPVIPVYPYVGAYNVYYVKWWAETRKPLVIYVKTEKTFSPMPFIVYVVHF